MQHVYPQLKEFCRKEYRLEFQVQTPTFSHEFSLPFSYAKSINTFVHFSCLTNRYPN